MRQLWLVPRSLWTRGPERPLAMSLSIWSVLAVVPRGGVPFLPATDALTTTLITARPTDRALQADATVDGDIRISLRTDAGLPRA